MAYNPTDILLDEYFTKKVQLRQKEIDKVIVKIEDLANALAKQCYNIDSRFSAQPDLVGSYWQGLKVAKPDEFDINICFDLGRPLVVKNAAPNHTNFRVVRCKTENGCCESEEYEYKVVSTALQENSCLPHAPYNCVYAYEHHNYNTRSNVPDSNISHDGVIVPALIRQHFKKTLQSALKSVRNQGYLGSYEVKDNGPAVCLTFTVDGREIRMDILPTIRTQVTQWLRRRWPRSKWWPGSRRAGLAFDQGLNLVAKDSESDPNFNYYFSMSFNLCETELCKYADVEGGKRKKCHRLMKQFAADFWFPGVDKPLVDSYMLKNVWLWHCEQVTQHSKWECLAERISDMICKLCDHLTQGRLDLYFNPDHNLFKRVNVNSMSVAAELLRHFLTNIDEHLRLKLQDNEYKCLDCSAIYARMSNN